MNDPRAAKTISSLGEFLSPSQRASRPTSGRWTSLQYETDEFPGSMIFTSNGVAGPQPVRIPLSVSGDYAIYLGIYFGSAPTQFWASGPHTVTHGAKVLLRVKLSADNSFDTVGDEYYGPKSGPMPQQRPVNWLHEIVEVHWKRANVRPGDDLLVASLPHEAFLGCLSTLAFVRLVPVHNDGERRDSRGRLIAHFDSSLFGGYPRDEAEVRELLEPLRGTDVGTLCWEMTKGDNCYYSTSIGRVLPAVDDPLVYPNYIPRDLRVLLECANPLEMFPRIAHDLGLRFFSSIRLMGTRFPYSFYTWHHDGGAFFEHRDWWTADTHGQPMPHFSLAFPQVRELFLDILAEQLAYDIDGVNILFNRCYPFVLFEEPFVRSFRQQYGQDPRTLDAMDQKLWTHRASFVTEFMHGVRKLADRASMTRGRRVEVSTIVMNSPRHCLCFGLDVEEWVRLGLVDQLVIHPCFSSEAFEPHMVSPENVSEWRALLGDSIRIYPDFYPRHLPPELMLPRMLQYYQAGADGISLWDCYSRFWRKSEWSLMSCGGDTELLDRWHRQMPEFRRTQRLRSYGGVSMDERYGAQTNG